MKVLQSPGEDSKMHLSIIVAEVLSYSLVCMHYALRELVVKQS